MTEAVWGGRGCSYGFITNTSLHSESEAQGATFRTDGGGGGPPWDHTAARANFGGLKARGHGPVPPELGFLSSTRVPRYLLTSC